jgi:hypothetical protein
MSNKNFWGKFNVFLIAFLFLLLSGFLLNLFSQGQISILYWMVIPSIIFEELIESSYPIIADNKLINLIFIFIFWYIVIYILLNIYVVLKIIKNEETKGRNN